MGLASGKAKIGSFLLLHLPVHRLGPFCPGLSGRDGEAECRRADEVEVEREPLGHDNEDGTSVAIERRKGRGSQRSLLLAGGDGV
jgi:hypothetical protein